VVQLVGLMWVRAGCLLLAAAVAVLPCDALQTSAAAFPAAAARRVAMQPAMLAKKQQQPKKRVKKNAKASSMPAAPRTPTAAAAPAPSAPSFSAPSSAGGDKPLDDRLDAVLQRAGISSSGSSGPSLSSPAKPGVNPSDPLASIPKAGQVVLERFFAGGAVTFGSAFILSGLAVAVEAIAKVLGNPLPTALDELLVQYVEPALTPSILILFGFSISLGLLKQLQLGSESTGVLYTESDDD